MPDVADLAMLFVVGLRVPMACRVRAQTDDRQDERDRQQSYGYSLSHAYARQTPMQMLTEAFSCNR